ncbi:hypothetical protein [Butyrivibrio sp. AE3003]|uniref:hypothetical protein n=1 Tax=Butyrivibrio sp. AE3003 TaxID=1496721 RepID=UPI00047C1EB7|nr:hypothetical protein [Butyrivibrio sp. AE3003]
MGISFDKYFDCDGNIREGVLADNKWLKFLTETDNVYVNAERLERYLDLLDENGDAIEYPASNCIIVAEKIN